MAKNRIGIQRTKNGWRAFVRVKGKLYPQRFPKTATFTEMQDWRAGKRTDVLRALLREGKLGAPGTLTADVQTYLKMLDGNPRLKREREAYLKLWTERFGDRARRSIRVREIQQTLADWASERYAFDTLKHRKNALAALYDALDHDADPPLPNPVRKARIPLKKPEPEARGLPLAQVLRILAAVSSQGGVFKRGDHSKGKGNRGGRYDASKTQARIHVMAYTGLRPEELKRYDPQDWRRDTHELIVRAAKGSAPRAVPLLPEAEHWLRELEARDATGRFNNGVVQRAFRRALAKVGYAPKLPNGQRKKAAEPKRRGGRARGRTGLIRPYDLRHSFGTAVYQQTEDLGVTQALMGHKDIRQTMRYAKNAIPHVQREAVARLTSAVAKAKATVTGSVTEFPTKRADTGT